MSDLTKLISIEEMEGWLDLSRREPVWVFKHSLTCPISGAALREYEAFAAGGDDESRCALIEVQTARQLSDELARRTGIRHESPQALLFQDGEVKWHASHWRIKADSLRNATAESG